MLDLAPQSSLMEPLLHSPHYVRNLTLYSASSRVGAYCSPTESDPILQDTPDAPKENVDYSQFPPDVGENILIDEIGRSVTLGGTPTKHVTNSLSSFLSQYTEDYDDSDDYPSNVVTYGETVTACPGIPYNDHTYASTNFPTRVVADDDSHLSLLAKLALAKDSKPVSKRLISSSQVTLDQTSPMPGATVNGINSAAVTNAIPNSHNSARLLMYKPDIKSQSSLVSNSALLPTVNGHTFVVPSKRRVPSSPLQVHRVTSSLTPQLVLRTSLPALQISTTSRHSNTSEVGGSIQCVCGSSDNDGCLIQCETCRVWFHTECISSAKTGGLSSAYTCDRCRSKTVNGAPTVTVQRHKAAVVATSTSLTNSSSGICISRTPLTNTGALAGRIFGTTQALGNASSRQLQVCLSGAPYSVQCNRPDENAAPPVAHVDADGNFQFARNSPHTGPTQPIRSSKRKQDLVTLTGLSANTGLECVSNSSSATAGFGLLSDIISNTTETDDALSTNGMNVTKTHQIAISTSSHEAAEPKTYGSLHRLLIQSKHNSSSELNRDLGRTSPTSSTLSFDSALSPLVEDNYEDAHDLRISNKLKSFLNHNGSLISARHTDFFKDEPRTIPTGPLRFRVVNVQGDHKGLVATKDLLPGEPIVEYRGLCMLLNEYSEFHDHRKRYTPFVLFHKAWSRLTLCIDARRYGNEARFVRRSCTPNCKVLHSISFLDDSSIPLEPKIRLTIVSSRHISASTELTIPFDFDYTTCQHVVHCACVRKACPVTRWFQHGSQPDAKPRVLQSSNSLIYSRKLPPTTTLSSLLTSHGNVNKNGRQLITNSQNESNRLRGLITADHDNFDDRNGGDVWYSNNDERASSIQYDDDICTSFDCAVSYRPSRRFTRLSKSSGSTKNNFEHTRRGRGRGRRSTTGVSGILSRGRCRATRTGRRGRPPGTGRSRTAVSYYHRRQLRATNHDDSLSTDQFSVIGSDAQEHNSPDYVHKLDYSEYHIRRNIPHSRRLRHREASGFESPATQSTEKRSTSPPDMPKIYYPNASMSTLELGASVELPCTNSQGPVNSNTELEQHPTSPRSTNNNISNNRRTKVSKASHPLERKNRRSNSDCGPSLPLSPMPTSNNRGSIKQKSQEEIWMAEVLRRIERMERKQSKSRTAPSDSDVVHLTTANSSYFHGHQESEEEDQQSTKSHDSLPPVSGDSSQSTLILKNESVDEPATQLESYPLPEQITLDTVPQDSPSALDVNESTFLNSTNLSPGKPEDITESELKPSPQLKLGPSSANVVASDSVLEDSKESTTHDNRSSIPTVSDSRHRVLKSNAMSDGLVDPILGEGQSCSREDRWLKSQLKRIAELDSVKAEKPNPKTISSHSLSTPTPKVVSMKNDLAKDGSEQISDNFSPNASNSVSHGDLEVKCEHPLSRIRRSSSSYPTRSKRLRASDGIDLLDHKEIDDCAIPFPNDSTDPSDTDCSLIVYSTRDMDPMAKFSRRRSTALAPTHVREHADTVLSRIPSMGSAAVCSTPHPTKKRWLTQALLEDADVLASGLTATADLLFSERFTAAETPSKSNQSVGYPVNPKKRLISQFSGAVDELFNSSSTPESCLLDKFDGTETCSGATVGDVTQDQKPTARLTPRAEELHSADGELDASSFRSAPLPPKKATVKQQAEEMRLQEMRKVRVSLSEYRRRRGLTSAVSQTTRANDRHPLTPPLNNEASLDQGELNIELPPAVLSPNRFMHESSSHQATFDGFHHNSNLFDRPSPIDQKVTSSEPVFDNNSTSLDDRLNERGPRTPSEPPDDDDDDLVIHSLLSDFDHDCVPKTDPRLRNHSAESRPRDDHRSWFPDSPRTNEHLPKTRTSSTGQPPSIQEEFISQRTSHKNEPLDRIPSEFPLTLKERVTIGMRTPDTPTSDFTSDARSSIPTHVPPPPHTPPCPVSVSSLELPNTNTDTYYPSVGSGFNSCFDSMHNGNSLDFFIKRDHQIRVWQKNRSYEWERPRSPRRRHSTNVYRSNFDHKHPCGRRMQTLAEHSLQNSDQLSDQFHDVEQNLFRLQDSIRAQLDQALLNSGGRVTSVNAPARMNQFVSSNLNNHP